MNCVFHNLDQLPLDTHWLPSRDITCVYHMCVVGMEIQRADVFLDIIFPHWGGGGGGSSRSEGQLGEWGERLSRLPLRGYCCTHSESTWGVGRAAVAPALRVYCCTHSESTWGVGRAAVAPAVKGLLLHTFRSQLGEWGERLSRLPLRGYCCTHSESTLGVGRAAVAPPVKGLLLHTFRVNLGESIWGVGRAAVAPAVKGLLLHTFKVNLGSGVSGCRTCRYESQLGEWGERLSRLPSRGYCCTHSESTWGVGRAAVAPAVKGLLLHTFRVNLGSGGQLGEWGERLSRLPLRGYCCTHSGSTWGVGRAAVAPAVKGLLLHTFRVNLGGSTWGVGRAAVAPTVKGLLLHTFRFQGQLGEWGERLSRLPLRVFCCTLSGSTWGVGRAAVAPAVKGLLLHTFRVNLGSGASGCRACR
ncbi:hypothetical protein RRG08_053515 [Elysia crispata]|uniref:Uncharacterized protein n=1 Tax=Elysia crispata TaxID=231223 RepID=A0AAE0Z416_9GAST|nr:hypothetical protein RRG08_053515 [Elysia crispata]